MGLSVEPAIYRAEKITEALDEIRNYNSDILYVRRGALLHHRG
ncbi:hypothetical protein [Nocardia salmonicida]